MNNINNAMKKLQESKKAQLRNRKLTKRSTKFIKESIDEPTDKKYSYKVTLDNGKVITATCLKKDLADAKKYFMNKTYKNTKTGESAKVVDVEENGSKETKNEDFGSKAKELNDNDPSMKKPYDSEANKKLQDAATKDAKIVAEEFGNKSKELNDNDPSMNKPYESETKKEIDDATKGKRINNKIDESKKLEESAELSNEQKLEKAKQLIEVIFSMETLDETRHAAKKELRDLVFPQKAPEETKELPEKKKELNESKKSGYIIFIKDDPNGYSYQGCGGRSRVRLDMTDALDVYDTVEQAQKEVNTYKNPKKIKIMKFDGKNTTELNESCNKKELKEEISARSNYDKLENAIDEGIITKDQIADELMQALSDDDLAYYLSNIFDFGDDKDLEESEKNLTESEDDLEVTNIRLSGQTEGLVAKATVKTDIGNIELNLLKLDGNYKCVINGFEPTEDEKSIINKYGQEALTKAVVDVYNDKSKVTESEEDKTKLEDRLASLKTQLEVDGDQLADDEKEAIQAEIDSLEKDLYESKQLKEGTLGKTLEIIYTDKDGNEKTTHFECDKDYELDGDQIREAIKSSDSDIVDIIKINESKCLNEDEDESNEETDKEKECNCDCCNKEKEENEVDDEEDSTIEDIDDETFTEAFTKFIKENYKNAKEFKLENVKLLNNGNYKFECKLVFNSGKERNVNLISNATIKEGKSLIRFYENKIFKHLDENKSIMTATVKLENKTLSCESLRYNYRVALKENKVATVKGIIK